MSKIRDRIENGRELETDSVSTDTETGLKANASDVYTKAETATEITNGTSAKLEATDYATATVAGVVKARLDGTDLYLTFDGTDA